jgi:YVTN family beta-propeller protein
MAGENLSIGDDFGGYVIAGIAGTGGMGVVYKAVQRALGRTVALKLIRPEIAESREYRWRFLREATLASTVDHPHIVTVFDIGDHEDLLYIAMQWVDGVDLRALLGRAPRLTADRAVLIGVQLAGALQALAEAGLVHRDVKPSNVLVRDLAGHDYVYLTDFGVAKLPGANDNLTRTGWQVGTSGYMSPEQVRGEPADSRSDLYALGCIVFEALTGTRPFSGDNELAVSWAHASAPRPVPSAVHPGLGRGYDAFFAQALAVDPADRFPTGNAFAAALQSAHSGEPAEATQAWLTEDAPTAVAGPYLPASRDAPGNLTDLPTAVAGPYVPAGPDAPGNLTDLPTAVAAPYMFAGADASPTLPGMPTAVARTGRPERGPARTGRSGRLVAIAAAVIVICGIAAALIVVTRPHSSGNTGGLPSTGALINVGVPTASIAITHNGTTAYVTSFKGDEVIPVDLATGTAGQPIIVGQHPFAIAITSDDRTAYVACTDSNAVYPVNLATGAVGSPIPVGSEPFAIAITSNDETAYVADSGNSSVTPIDLATGAPGAAIPVGGSPQSIAIAPSQQTVYVGNYDDGTVTPINVATNTPGTPIRVGSGPAAIAITPDGQTAYVVNNEDSTVTPIDLANDAADAAIPVGSGPFAIAITPDGQTAYVANVNASTVTPIDLATGQAGPAIAVGSQPHGIAITPDGQTALVADGGDDNVTPLNNLSG